MTRQRPIISPIGRGLTLVKYAVTSARLVCSKCKWEFPGSYKLSLMGGMALLGNVVGATPGFGQFGASGQCPQCGSSQSFYIYDNPSAEEITAHDLEAIREYQRHLAQEWWKTETRTEAICDHCNSSVPRDQGYLSGSSLYCENCERTLLGDQALDKLRENPDYFGSGVLRQARQYHSDLHEHWLPGS